MPKSSTVEITRPWLDFPLTYPLNQYHIHPSQSLKIKLNEHALGPRQFPTLNSIHKESLRILDLLPSCPFWS